jgi:hypothetical protein
MKPRRRRYFDENLVSELFHLCRIEVVVKYSSAKFKIVVIILLLVWMNCFWQLLSLASLRISIMTYQMWFPTLIKI